MSPTALQRGEFEVGESSLLPAYGTALSKAESFCCLSAAVEWLWETDSFGEAAHSCFSPAFCQLLDQLSEGLRC